MSSIIPSPSRSSSRPVNSEQAPLPEGFIQSIAHLLQAELGDFLDVMGGEPYRALRFSVRRENPVIEGLNSPVAWANNAYYIKPGAQPGAHPLHWAGAYYIQEPSAMAAAAALGAQPGEAVLDVCAAPGGKATQLADMMQGQGVLIANDPVLPRARELSRNIERMGITNAVVLSNTPAQLAAAFLETFDRILVDAPCSGEGMFRKEPQSMQHWTPDVPAVCALRQADILSQAALMLKQGGSLVYSTCTFNDVENEGVIQAFLHAHPDFVLQPFALPGLREARDGMLRLWPHQVPGEGHFVALMKKRGETQRRKDPAQQAGRDMLHVQKIIQDWVLDDLHINHQLGDVFTQLPLGTPPLHGLRILRAGLHIAQRVGKTLRPDHALALACKPRSQAAITLAEADAYRRGEVITVADHSLSGFVAPTCSGWPLGWAKAMEGQLKNHYPKGLRKYSFSYQ